MLKKIMDLTKFLLEEVKINSLNIILNLYKNSIEKMKMDNIDQWDFEIYPNKKCLKKDILKNEMFAGIIEKTIVSTVVVNKEFSKEYLDCKWDYNGDNFIVIHRLCVNSDYQNNGIAAKTMSIVEIEWKNKGIESIKLDAFSKNPAALRLYDNLGYKKVGEMDSWKGIFYIFEKKL